MIKNIIFDFDGTIADSFQIMVEAFPKILRNHNIPISDNISEKIIHNTDLKEILRKNKLWIFKIRGVETTIQNEQYKRMNDVKNYEGIEDLFKRLNAKGLKLFIVSTNTSKFVNEYLKLHNLDRYFLDVNAGGSVFGKARIIRKFLKKNKLTKEETIYIGDEERDIKASKEVGIKVISVSYGYKSYEFLKKYEPDYIVKTVDKLKQLLLEELV